MALFGSKESKEEKEARKDGYSINCGARHCLSCLRCYKAKETKKETSKKINVKKIIITLITLFGA